MAQYERTRRDRHVIGWATRAAGDDETHDSISNSHWCGQTLGQVAVPRATLLHNHNSYNGYKKCFGVLNEELHTWAWSGHDTI